MIKANPPWWALGVFACVLLEPPGDARAFPYTAQRGDTLAQLSERVYGKVEMEKVLVAANGFDGDVPMLAGMRVEVPAIVFHRVAPGETWASLAETQLGDERRAEALALSNESMPWIPPPTGREIILPYPLRYVVRKGDSTLTIAYHFLKKRDLAYVVDRYNNLRGEPLAPGDVVIVPVTDLTLTDEGKELAKKSLATLAGQSGGDDRDAQDRAERELPLLAAEVRSGRYVAAVARANQLLGAGDHTAATLGAIHRQLLEALVALDEHKEAEQSCAEWRRHVPDAVLDPIELSPKILRACSRAVLPSGVGHIPDDVDAPSPSAAPGPPR